MTAETKGLRLIAQLEMCPVCGDVPNERSGMRPWRTDDGVWKLSVTCMSGSHGWNVDCEPDAEMSASERAGVEIQIRPAATYAAARRRLHYSLLREMVTAVPGLRDVCELPAGPLEVLVMSLARELHDREHLECDWFSHNGSSVTSFCRRACEARGLDWKWVYAAIERERLDEKTDLR